MNPNIESALAIVLVNWQKMQDSTIDDAEEDADRFEASFYYFTNEVKKWLMVLNLKQLAYNEIIQKQELKEIFDKLPGPLYINFEMELEEMLEEGTNEKK